MTIMEPTTCICYYERSGCQDITEIYNWGWNGEDFFSTRPNTAIQNVVWTIPPELDRIDEQVVGVVFWVQLGNLTGVADETYEVYADMTTTGGERARLRINITLTDITANN